jgi:SNF2 family DNA or RNA helicase
MNHQSVGLALLRSNAAFMLSAEQGTGKTWMLLADAEERYLRGDITGLLVLAPNGVHTNWVRREIPTHVSVPVIARWWRAGASKKHLRSLEELFGEKAEGHLAVLAMNLEAVNTPNGRTMAMRFLRSFRCAMVVDESHRIKNPSAATTKHVMELARFAPVRRTATGTAISNSPSDAFAQFEFLEERALGYTSYRAFVARYTQLVPINSRFVLDIIAKRHPKLVQEYKAALAEGLDTAHLTRQLARFAPQIASKDGDGARVHMNLEELADRMAPRMYRVLKKDCLDLPEKVYCIRDFELRPAQRALYDRVADTMRFTSEDGNVSIFNTLNMLGKLQQITSGFITTPEDGIVQIDTEDNARLAALEDLLDDVEGQFIIWAGFKEELRAIAALLERKGITYVSYHGDVSKAEREIAVDTFQSGAARAFAGTAAAGGTGLTLTAASTVIYYSNTLKLVDRVQSEDRAHRIGTINPVTYIDLVAADTRDEDIAVSLQRKLQVAEFVLNKNSPTKELQ